MEQPILITGCARSGTSMTAGVIHLCGAFGGAMAGPTRYNQRGMFENLEIKNEIIKPYLREIGADPMGQWPLPSTSDLPVQVDWKERVERIITAQGYRGGAWMHKEAKACLIWPIWHSAFPDAKWVIVRRDEDAITDSCIRTPFMRAFTNRVGWQRWVDHHLACFTEMHKAGLDIMEFWPDPSNPQGFWGMIEWLGLSWNAPAVIGFLAPELYHTKASAA